jgi:arginine exporter protein ArgO
MAKGFKKSFIHYTLNIAIIILAVVCAYLIFSLFTGTFSSKNETEKDISDTTKQTITKQPNLTIQLDVRNGTGVNGVASVFRNYLREKGFDVVEMGNYKTNDVNKTMIISRTESMQNSEKIAAALGINKKFITQQINPSLYLDATVIIGKDFKELKPYTNKTK